MFRTPLCLAALALLLGRPLCVQSERVYFLSGEGLHSVTTSGDDEQHLAPWGASAGTCATAASGLSVDEVTGWATVSCGQKFFKIHYDKPSLGSDPWVLLTFGSARVIRDYYGTAIDTDTHTAYVAAFDQAGWRVKGVYLSGCASITDTAECAEHNPCSWSDPRDACVDKTGYAQLEVSSLSDVGGGLFADERNKIWFAYFEQAAASGKQGGFVVSNQKNSDDDPAAVVSYPHVHDTFKADQPGVPAMEMGYPQKTNGSLFVLQQTADATALLRFDGAPMPTVVYDSMPPFKGSRTGSSSTIRQPSFAMLSENSLIHSTEDGIVLLEGLCDGCTAPPVSTPLVSRQNVGPIFYRMLPKTPPDTPTPDTPEPDTPLPEGGDTPAPEATTAAPTGTTPTPAGESPDTAVPTPAPDGAGTGRGTQTPGGSSTEAPSETSGAAPSKEGGGGVSVLALVLLIVGSMVLCLCVGLSAGAWYKGRFKKQAQQRAQVPTDDEMLLREAAAAERPATPPSATAAYVAAGDRQTSLSMIQTVDLPTKTRMPAVDLHQPAPPATQQSPPQQQQQQQQPSPPQQQPVVVGAAALGPGRGPSRSFKAPEPLSPLSPTSVGRGASIRPPSRGATPTNLTSPMSVSGGSVRRPTPRTRFASVSDRSQASDLVCPPPPLPTTTTTTTSTQAQTFIQQRASQNQQRLSQHLSVVAVEDV